MSVHSASDPASSSKGDADVAEFATGEVVASKYRVERTIGRGGMGVVLAAWHEDLHQRVAIKVLAPERRAEDDLHARFLREARALASVTSAHVARVFDVGRLPSGSPYMVMEYLEGSDLSRVIESKGPAPVEQAVDWALEACDAVAEAHHRGIVHRDLKPSNLFLAHQDDGTAVVKVLDFGISKVRAEPGGTLTTTGGLLGSPLYMSPEQIRCAKDVDHRTDVWSLGVVLFELLAGRPPFDAPASSALYVAIAVEAPLSLAALRPELPRGLVECVDRCLKKDPDKRFASVTEFALAIAQFGSDAGRAGMQRMLRLDRAGLLGASTVASKHPPPLSRGGATSAGAWSRSRVPSPASRRRTMILGGAGACLVFTAGAVVAWSLTASERGSAAETATPSATALATAPAPAARAPTPASSERVVGATEALPSAGVDLAAPSAAGARERRQRRSPRATGKARSPFDGPN